MKTALSAVLLGTALFFSVPQSAMAQSLADSRQKIDALIETFRQAIINKDTAGFMQLFLREDITWTAVYSDGSVDRYNASLKDPKEPRGTKIQNSSPRKFIESIARAKETMAETFSNVRIDTDGDVAQVWFDYTFIAGDYKNNWGKESWQLVRTEAGWKIAAVVWSAEENPVPRVLPKGAN
ncbi:nuclear transport factor 2 family protein [Massilia niabensis]|uniref:Nuclear transport factor 2 family protein n=1 Tax=Massilia niabensis TaxID=544910 RepID=A0ABW0KZ67_9BURK